MADNKILNNDVLEVKGVIAHGELRIGTHAVHDGYTGLWNTEASTTTTGQYLIISAGTDTYINGDSVYIRGGNNSTTNQLRVQTTGVTIGGNTVWHAGNDGASSGLDADTVDGIHASSFLRSDANDTASGNLTLSANDWYLLGLGARGASSGAYGIGNRNDDAYRQLTFHVPNQDAYSSSGTIPSFGWYSNGAVQLMKLDSASGNLWLKGELDVDTIAIGSGVTLTESTDRSDLLMIKSSTSSWGGLQVSNTSNEGIISLMINGNEGGLYDDQNGEWILKSTENGGLTLGYNNETKLTTTSTGISVTGGIVASDLIEASEGISSDGNSKFYNWRALDNSSNSGNFYWHIGTITGSQSTRFMVTIAGRSTSYSDDSLPAMGHIVGQLNNDDNYDIVFYNHSTASSEVVSEVGIVDDSTDSVHIYVKTGNYAELTATAHVSDGSITTNSNSSSDGTSSAPDGYTAVTEYTAYNSGNLTGGQNVSISSSGVIASSHPTIGATAGTYGDTANGQKIDTITIDENGHVTAVATGATGNMTGFFVEDGDGTEVQINNANEWKFVEGTGIDINWTDTTTGNDSDPYDLTFAVKDNSIGIDQLTVTDGTNGQVLTTNGAGELSFATVTSGTSYGWSLNGTDIESGDSISLAGGLSLSGSNGSYTLTQTDTTTNYYVNGLSFDTATGILTASVNGATNQTVDLDGRYLEKTYRNNFTRLGYGNSGSTRYHKLVTIRVDSSYDDYNATFEWTGRYSQGMAGIHVHSDNDTTADVLGAWYEDWNPDQKLTGNGWIKYTQSGDTVEVWVKTVGWREFDYILKDSVTEGTPAITWYDESTTTDTATEPSNLNSFANNNHFDAGYLTAHPSITEASSNLSNSGRTYIQSITLDSNGHVTGVSTGTETVTNTDTNTVTSVGVSGSEVTGTVTIAASGAASVSQSGNTVTISATDTDTVYVHPTGAGNKHIPSGGAAGQFLKYSSSGTAVWATPSYTTNTDTTYSAGSGLDLTSTTFSVEADLRDGITHVGKDGNNYIQFDSTNGRIDFYAGGTFVARLESDGDLHVKGDVIAFSDIFS